MDWKTRLIKRSIDVVGASVGLAITAPLFPIVAVAVRMTSKGPVFFTQPRCAGERRTGIPPSRPPISERRRGRRFRTFNMFKFRTMQVDAEARSGAVLAKKNDPRLTPIGGFLRKTRLDELPQLVHVLRGEMSLVGPRPERPELMDKIAQVVPFFEERMRLIKPGITGLAQVKLGYDGSPNPWSRSKNDLERFIDQVKAVDPSATDNELSQFANKLLYDLAYSAILENPWELFKTDCKILVKTPLVMVLGMGR